jgi:flagellar biosynthesis/type III secretory pathway protein FliH
VQQRAIQELEALPQDNPLRSQAINLLLNLKTTLELSQNVDEEDRELFMQIANIYEQVKQEGREEGRQEAIQTERRTTIENALRVRFGSMDEELMAIIEQLVALSPEEFMPLLFQLSREDLLARFR